MPDFQDNLHNQSGDGSLDRAPVRTGGAVYRLKFWLRRYWWIPALTIMIGLIIMDVLCLRDKPMYVSGARMMVSGRVALPQTELYNGVTDSANFYGTQVALMKSPQTINLAIDRVQTVHPEIAIDKDAEADAGVELRTSIFDLKVTSANPDYAKLLLDALMDTYLANKKEWQNQTTDEAVSAITEELSHLEAQLRTDSQAMLDFEKNNNVVFIEEQSNSAASYLVSLENEEARLTKEHDLIALENKDPLASDAAAPVPTGSGPVDPGDAAVDPPMPDGAGSDNGNHILAVQDEINKLKISRDHFSLKLKDAHPKMKDLTEKIESEQKFLDNLKLRSSTARKAYQEDLQLRIQNLDTQIGTWRTKSLELSQSLGTYQDLKSTLARDQGLYNQLSSSIQNVDLNKSIDQEDVVIMEAASPAVPVSRNYLLRLLYGVGGGLAAGLLIIFVLIRLDDKVNSSIDLEENLDFPIIGEIPLVPLDKKSKRVPLLVEGDQRHSFLEHHRDIRSNILFGRSDLERNRSIMITSAAPGEGKSTLAANLAATFAFSGFRVLLIDADLRRGILHASFNLPPSPGLSDYLQGDVSWREVIHPTGIANLDLMPRGKIPRGAGDLLLSAATDELVVDTALEYDAVFWDTAPLFAAHDAANLCSRVDAVLFLTRARHSSVKLVRAALADLYQRNAKIFGVVLNAVKSGESSYYQKYRYKEYGAVEAET